MTTTPKPLARMANPDRLNALLTTRWAERAGWDEPVVVNPSAFQVLPVGCRILVVLDPVPQTYKNIHLPDSYRMAEQAGIGTIMGVGLEAFGGNAPYPFAPGTAHPEDMLYRTVITGQHVGNPVRLDFVRDTSYYSGVIVMADRDVWCVLDDNNKQEN